MVVILVEWKSINFMPFVRSAVGRPRWSLAAAGRDHALAPLVRAVRSQRGRLRRRKMIHPAARHMRPPTALATGDPWGGGGCREEAPSGVLAHAFHGDHITSAPAILLQAHGLWLPKAKLCQAAAARWAPSLCVYFFRSCSSNVTEESMLYIIDQLTGNISIE